MPVFEYKGKTVTGSIVEGELKVKDRGELDRILRRNRIIVEKVNRKLLRSISASAAASRRFISRALPVSSRL